MPNNGSQVREELLLTTTLDSILTATEPPEVLRSAAAALCQGLPAAGALWVLPEEDGPRLFPYGDAAPLLAQARSLQALRGAALRLEVLDPRPLGVTPSLKLVLRLRQGAVAALWLVTPDTAEARAACRSPALLALDRADLLRAQHETQRRWSQIVEELPAALALCAPDGQVVLTNRELRALLAQPPGVAGGARRRPSRSRPPRQRAALDTQRLQPLQLSQRVAEALTSGATVICDEAPQADGRALTGALAPLYERPAPRRLAPEGADSDDDAEADGAGCDDRPGAPVAHAQARPADRDDPDLNDGDDDDDLPRQPPRPAPGRPLGAVLLVHDATHERRLQRRLLLGERMAAVGQLAAGLAHEINNPVSIAYADLQIAREMLAEHSAALPPGLAELPEMVDECLAGIGRVRDIVRDLRAFTSTEVRSQPGEARLDDIIDQALRLIRSEVQRRARLVYDRDMLPLPTVRGDAGRLGQVVLNLLNQAQLNLPPLDASGPSAHRITVRTRADARRGMVELLVVDSGPTLAEEVRARLFEPFAQRRPRAPAGPAGVAVALSMGLAISYEVVRRLGGDIESRAAPGGGNELLVRLPQFQPSQHQSACRADAAGHPGSNRDLT